MWQSCSGVLACWEAEEQDAACKKEQHNSENVDSVKMYAWVSHGRIFLSNQDV